MNESKRYACPKCGRFLGITDGSRFDSPPCKCGWQTIWEDGHAVSTTLVKRVPRNRERIPSDRPPMTYREIR